MKQINIHKKEQEGKLYENGVGKKIVGHSKLNVNYVYSSEVKVNVNDLYTD